MPFDVENAPLLLPAALLRHQHQRGPSLLKRRTVRLNFTANETHVGAAPHGGTENKRRAPATYPRRRSRSGCRRRWPSWTPSPARSWRSARRRPPRPGPAAPRCARRRYAAAARSSAPVRMELGAQEARGSLRGCAGRNLGACKLSECRLVLAKPTMTAGVPYSAANFFVFFK